MNSLEIKDLEKVYPNGVKALNKLTLDIPNGMFGLLGPNGAGKSSFMRSIAGLQKPDSGSILFNGIDIVASPELIRKDLGYLPQEFGVYPQISAYRLLDHIAILKGISNASARHDQILFLLEQTNLTGHANRAVHTFSGGMKQRFGIAQALLGDPKLIIADEPTAGLDPEERNRFNTLLTEIGNQVIVILSTHIVEDVKNLCTNMAVLNQGKILLNGKPSELIEQIKSKVWQRAITRDQLDEIKSNFQLISSRLHSGKLMVHVLSDDKPAENFSQVEPDLEDVYFSALTLERLNSLNYA